MFKINHVLRQAADDNGGDNGGGGGEGLQVFSEGLNFSENWFNDFKDPEFDAHRSLASQFKDLPSVFKSLHETKAKLSESRDGLVKVPGEGASEDEISAFRQAIGVPSLDEYEIKAPELPEGVEFKDEDLASFKEFAHKNGLTPDQASALIDYQAKVESAELAKWKGDQEEQAKQVQAELQREWGNQYQQNLNLADRAAKTFGIDEKLMSDPSMIRAMAKIGGSISEDKLVEGDKPGVLSPEAQALDMQKNPGNPMYAAYNDSSHPQHSEAVATFQRLIKEQTDRERR